MGDVQVEVPAVDIALADQLGRVGLLDRRFQAFALEDVFAADIDIGRMRPDRVGRDQAAFDQQVRVIAQDLAVLAGAGLGLVGVDHQIVRAVALLLGHEGPLQAGGEAGAAAATQARILDLVAEPFRRLSQHVARRVPAPTRLRALQAPVMEAIDVREDAVLVFQDSDHDPLLSPVRAGGPGDGHVLRGEDHHAAGSLAALPLGFGGALGSDLIGLAAEPS
ncbi:hypothetical protein GALL_493970 [mine drainage metagenome]|uniref:Uncharacterized protein n=1 Tax=mine drainage metagenome TaxID=410659 RepID=A0A1J5PML9_9ZZZZ